MPDSCQTHDGCVSHVLDNYHQIPDLVGHLEPELKICKYLEQCVHVQPSLYTITFLYKLLEKKQDHFCIPI